VTIKNLTDHPIVILNSDNKRIMYLHPEGEPARVKKIVEQVDYLGAIPLSEARFGKIKNLPPPSPNVIYIVSKMVFEAAKDRSDLYYPAEKIRDNKGRVLGCKSLGLS